MFGSELYLVEKELRKFSRRELIDVIYQLKKNEEQLQNEIASLQEELNDKRIHISNAGSIADAASSITNLFSAAEETANLYLNEIACIKEEAEKERERIIEEAEKKALNILSEAEKSATEAKSIHDTEKNTKKSVNSSKHKKTKKKKKR
jgi:cell division septum initiation protein DivIVA